MGCAIADTKPFPSQIALKLASAVSSKHGATVSAAESDEHELAVFANGVMIRNLDFNDAYTTPAGGGHPSDTLVPASFPEVAGVRPRSHFWRWRSPTKFFAKSLTCSILKPSVWISPRYLVGQRYRCGWLMGLSQEEMVNSIASLSVEIRRSMKAGVGALSMEGLRHRGSEPQSDIFRAAGPGRQPMTAWANF